MPGSRTNRVVRLYSHNYPQLAAGIRHPQRGLSFVLWKTNNRLFPTGGISGTIPDPLRLPTHDHNGTGNRMHIKKVFLPLP